MERDNERLAGLLEWSNALGDSEHVSDVLARPPRARERWRCRRGLCVPEGRQRRGARARAERRPGRGAALHSARGRRRRARAPRRRVGPARDARVRGRRHGRGGGAAPGDRRRRARSRCCDTAPPFEPGELDALSTLASMSAVSLQNADLRDAQRNFFSHVTDMLVTALDRTSASSAGTASASHSSPTGSAAARPGRRGAAAPALRIAAARHRHAEDRPEPADERASPAISTAYSAPACSRGSGSGATSRRSSTSTTSGSTAAAIRKAAGAAIPREARIIALCDAVDSMTSDDSYRTPARTRRRTGRDPALLGQPVRSGAGRRVLRAGARRPDRDPPAAPRVAGPARRFFPENALTPGPLAR